MLVESQRRTTQIVAAYMRKNFIPTDQIAGLINAVHSTLSGLGREIVEEPPRVPAVSVRRSVRPGYIICIECGYNGKMLKRHLQARHGLSVNQYRLRWKLPSDYPMTAPNYSEQRSQFAKSIGLGRGRAQAGARAKGTVPEKSARRVGNKVTGRTDAKKARGRTSARNAGSKASARSGKTNPRKTSLRSSAKTASNRPRSRTSSRTVRKASSARKSATA